MSRTPFYVTSPLSIYFFLLFFSEGKGTKTASNFNKFTIFFYNSLVVHKYRIFKNVLKNINQIFYISVAKKIYWKISPENPLRNYFIFRFTNFLLLSESYLFFYIYDEVRFLTALKVVWFLNSRCNVWKPTYSIHSFIILSTKSIITYMQINKMM